MCKWGVTTQCNFSIVQLKNSFTVLSTAIVLCHFQNYLLCWEQWTLCNSPPSKMEPLTVFDRACNEFPGRWGYISLTPHHADGHRSSTPVLLLSGGHLLEAARGPDRWHSGPPWHFVRWHVILMMTHHFTRSLSSSLEKYSPPKTLPLLSLFQAEQHKVITVRTERGLSGGSVWSAELLSVALWFCSLLEVIFRALATALKQLFFSHVF